MKNRILALLLVICMLMTCVPTLSEELVSENAYETGAEGLFLEGGDELPAEAASEDEVEETPDAESPAFPEESANGSATIADDPSFLVGHAVLVSDIYMPELNDTLAAGTHVLVYDRDLDDMLYIAFAYAGRVILTKAPATELTEAENGYADTLSANEEKHWFDAEQTLLVPVVVPAPVSDPAVSEEEPETSEEGSEENEEPAQTAEPSDIVVPETEETVPETESTAAETEDTDDEAAIMIAPMSLPSDEDFDEEEDPTYLDMGVGDTCQLTSFWLGEDISWYSDVPSIASVNDSGLVTANSYGTTIVYAATEEDIEYWVVRVMNSVTTMSMSVNEYTMGVGETTDAVHPVFGAGEYTLALRIESDDEAIVSVSDTGVLTAKSEGNALVTATTTNGLTAVCAVTVKPAPESVSAAPVSFTLGVGESITPNITLSEGSHTTLTYENDSETVLSISDDGVFKGLAVGMANVTVRTHNDKTVKLTVRVAAEPASVSVTSSFDSICLGQTLKMTAAPNSGSASAITWTTEDSDILSVEADGSVTGMGVGTTTVTAKTYNGLTADTKVTVTEAPTSINLGIENNAISMGVGQKLQLKPDCGIPTVTYTYSTSSKSIATVSSSGLIKAVATGKAYIEVSTFNNVTATLTVTVKAAPTKIAINPSKVTIGLGEKYKVGYKLDKGATAVTWLSEYPDRVSIAEDGTVTGLKTTGSGYVRIKGTTHNGKSAIGYVYVKPAPTTLTVSPTELRLGVGQTLSLSGAINSGSASAIDYMSIDENLATVSAGKVTGVCVGTTTVYATTYNGLNAPCTVTVVPAPEYVTLPEKKVTIGVGQIIQLTPDVGAESVGGFTYSSAKTKYAATNAQGQVKGIAAGTSRVTVKTYNGLTDYVDVVVRAAPKSVSLSAKSGTLGVGDTYQLTYKLPSNTAAGVTWSSSNDSVVTVDSDGTLHAAAIGSATVKIKTHNGKTASCSIKVVAAPSKVTVTPDTLKVGVGQTLPLKAAVDTAGSITWTVDKENIASVDAKGNVTGIAAGETLVTATAYNDVFENAAVEVVEAPTVLTPNVTEITIGIGQKFTLTADTDTGVTAFTFKSSNKKYATVSESGVVKGVAVGTSTMTISAYNGVSANVTVRVQKAPGSIAIKPTSITLGVGETYQLGYKLPSKTSASVKWYSENTDYFTVDANGLVTAIKPTTSKLRVKVQTHNGKSAMCTVKVVPAPSRVMITPESLMVGVGQTLSLSAKTDTAGAITWDTVGDCVTVENGDVTGAAVGTTHVIAKTYNEVFSTAEIEVVPAPTELSLPYTSITIGVGQIVTLEPETDGRSPGLTYKTSASKYVAVNAAGQFKGKAVGSATVTVSTYNGLTAKVAVKVVNAPGSISLAKTSLKLGKGESYKMTYKLPSKTATSVTWLSSNTSIVEVDEYGVITAVAVGSAKIRAKTHNGKYKDCTVTVLEAPTELSVKPKELLIGVGQTSKLTATMDENSSSFLTWTSEEPAVATVGTDGTVKGVNVGETTVSVGTFNGLKSTMHLTVIEAPTTLTLPSYSITLGLGEMFQLEPDVGNSVGGFTYSSSATKYVQVSSYGMLLGRAAGTSTITVKTYNGLKKTVKVTVKAAPTKVVLDKYTMNMTVGTSDKLLYKFQSGGAGSVDFATSDDDIVDVDENGNLHAIAVGTAVITVRSYNGKSASCTVSVMEAPSYLKVSPASGTPWVGQTGNLTVTYDEGTWAQIFFESSNTKVVTVSAEGALKAVGTGKADIRVYTKIPGLETKASFTVIPAPTSVKLPAASVTLSIKDTLQLAPTLLPAGCADKLTYSSSNNAAATVDENGLVTPVEVGKTTITVTTCNGLKATMTVTVYDPLYPTSVSLLTKPAYLVKGETMLVEYKLSPSTAAFDLQFSSSNTSVATIDTDGVITAKGQGYTTITLVSKRNSSCKATYKLIVWAKNPTTKLPAMSCSNTSSEISAIKTDINAVKSQALNEISMLKAAGIISSSDASKRTSIINNAFADNLLAWMTPVKQSYWKAANSEGGAKDFKTGVVYFGVPYTQYNRTYTASKLISQKMKASGSIYKLNVTSNQNGYYWGSDCSSFVSAAIWGVGNSHAADTTSVIAGASYYKKVSYKDLRPGDILNKKGSHVVMFLYYTDESRTKAMLIEQGGSRANATVNCVHCSHVGLASYENGGYVAKRLNTLGS